LLDKVLVGAAERGGAEKGGQLLGVVEYREILATTGLGVVAVDGGGFVETLVDGADAVTFKVFGIELGAEDIVGVETSLEVGVGHLLLLLLGRRGKESVGDVDGCVLLRGLLVHHGV
jgi:hypothetical protein